MLLLSSSSSERFIRVTSETWGDSWAPQSALEWMALCQREARPKKTVGLTWQARRNHRGCFVAILFLGPHFELSKDRQHILAGASHGEVLSKAFEMFEGCKVARHTELVVMMPNQIPRFTFHFIIQRNRFGISSMPNCGSLARNEFMTGEPFDMFPPLPGFALAICLPC